MRIAVAGVVTKEINEHPLGGTEAFTYMLVKGLVKKGHEVTLYCAKGSKTPAQNHVEICNPQDAMGELSNLHFVYPYTMLEVRRIIEDVKMGKFDIIHVNFLKTFIMTYFADQVKIPILYTMHRDFFAQEKIYELYKKIGFHKNEHFVFVSKKAQELSILKENVGYVHNGIDVSKFPFAGLNKQNSLLWFSRIDELKGPAEAAEAATKAKAKLIISGSIDRSKYQDYFDSRIGPLLNEDIRFEAAPDQVRKVELYQTAKAFLFPIQWEEPFGLVIAEAMACGTPVISFALGAIPEIIEDGKSGYIVNYSDEDRRGEWIIKKTGLEGIAEAIKKVYSLSEDEYAKMRQASRARIENNFTLENTIEKYEKIYKDILHKKG